jgi:hypothetical protein
MVFSRTSHASNGCGSSARGARVRQVLGVALAVALVPLCLVGASALAAPTSSGTSAAVEAYATPDIDPEKASPKEMRDYAQSALAEIKAADARVARIAGSSEQCARQGSQTLPVLVEVVSYCIAQIDRYLAGGETNRAASEVRKVQVALSMTRKIAKAASDCEARGSGTSSVDVTIGGLTVDTTYDGELLGDGYVDDFFDTLDGADIPPDASPFF